jgi:diacylglycerol kinase family enzyme/membrane-associated phospholipid phosphatase
VRADVVRRLARTVAAGDRWAVGRTAQRESVLLDVVLPALGRSANYGRLWLILAGGMAVTRDKRARRAALRGLVALGVASSAANVVTKAAVGRQRPATELIPVVRRLRRTPVTTSFPSGHAASAAAFATGVALEVPLLGVPVAVLAAAVAASRVVTGAHYPSDVLAGAAIGAGAGALTLWWWPSRPAGPARAAQPDIPAPAAPTGRGVVAVVNAGAGSAADVAEQLAESLPEAEIVRVGPDEDLVAALTAAADRATVLGVAGGDGTVNLAARLAADRDLPLLVVPAGTLNHFAQDLGLHSPADAVWAVRTGRAVRVDLGSAGEHVFLNTSSVGLYADLVRFRERWEGRVGKWPAVLVGLVHVLRRSSPQDLLVDGEARRVWMLFAGNGRYRPTGFAPAYRPDLADGALDVRIVDARFRFARTRIVLAALTRTLRFTPSYAAHPARELRIEVPGQDIRLSLDGEVLRVPGALTLGVRRRALLVYRP